MDQKAETYIQDADTRKKVLALARMNRQRTRPLEGMGVLAIGGKSVFAPDEFAQLKAQAEKVRLLLFLCMLSSNVKVGRGANAGIYIATSENCALTYQNFDGGPYTGTRAGVIVSVGIGGWKISEITHQVPPFVLSGSLRRPINLEIARHLLRLEKARPLRFRQILTAAEALFESYHNAEDVSHNSRILNQVRALEILFKLPQKDQKKAAEGTD